MSDTTIKNNPKNNPKNNTIDKVFSPITSSDNESKDLVSMSSILKKFISQSDLFKSPNQQIATQLWRNWSQLTKNTVLQHTRPVSYNQGRLVLWVEHSTLSNEVHFYTDQLKQTINTFFKKTIIEEIYFTLNKGILNNRKRTMHLLNKLT